LLERDGSKISQQQTEKKQVYVRKDVIEEDKTQYKEQGNKKKTIVTHNDGVGGNGNVQT